MFPLQETALECHFGTDRSFEARWVNSSAVECIHVLVSRGRPPAPAPHSVGQVPGQGGSCPQPPTQQLGCHLPPPPLLPAGKSFSRARSPLRRGALCVRWCWGVFTAPALQRLLRGIRSSSSPRSPGLWDRAACLPFQMGRVQFRQKKLATSQCCYFCSFYSELGIGLRKCSAAHQRAVCGCWRENRTSELQQAFGPPPMGIQ